MYDDGWDGIPGQNNADCNSATDPGCWGHRNNILGDYSSPILMGAEYNSQNPGFAEEFIAGDTTDSPYFTWSQETPFLPVGVSTTAINLATTPGSATSKTFELWASGEDMNVSLSLSGSPTFSLGSDTCQLAAGSECTLTVRFSPSQAGTYRGTLLVSGPNGQQVVPVAGVTGSGYDMVGRDGGVFVFSPPGTTGGFYGSLPGLGVKVNNIVGMVPTSTDQGYFLVGSDGGVFAFGNAPFLGSLPGLGVRPTQPITGIVAADTDKGYFLVGRDGGVFAFGTVPFLGSLPSKGISVNNIIGIASTPSGNGYWLVAATGTVYGFGAAEALGTARGTSSPVSAIAGTPTGGGYWITTQNGTVYPFGNARKPSPGTLPALSLTPALPVIGIVHTADTSGYWLIGADGGIFAFGDAGFVGSLPGLTVHVTDVVGAVPTTG